MGSGAAELCSISQMRCKRASLRGTGVPSTRREAIMISATYMRLCGEKGTKRGCEQNGYLIRCFRVFQTESHASSKFATGAAQRSKHGVKAFSSQFAEFRLAGTLLFRLLGGICGEDAVVTLHHIVNPYSMKIKRCDSHLILEFRLYRPIPLYQRLIKSVLSVLPA